MIFLAKEEMIMKGQLNLFEGYGEEVCMPLTAFSKTPYTMEKVQKLFKDAISIVKREGFPLESIDETCRLKEMRAWGSCHHNKTRNAIYVSPQLLDTNEHSIMQTLLHEVLHATEGCHNHGSLWKSRAGIINRKYGYNIKTTNNPDELGASENYISHFPYVFRCKGCGQQACYKRKCRFVQHPEYYMCGKCGGKFEQIK